MKHVRRVAAIALVLAAMPVALAAASSSLSGTWNTDVKTAGELNGNYKITFTPGHFTIVGPYQIAGHGTYSLSGSRLTIHGPSKNCTAAGLYEVRQSGSSLTFKKIKDPCERWKVLTAHALKKT
jgi:hypothetical protein